MKKLVALFLILAMSLSLCACGGTDDSKPQQTEAPAVETTEADSPSVEFEEPLVIFENDTAKVELLNFFEKEFNWSGKGPAVEKMMTVKIHNKTDHEIWVQLNAGYLGSDNVKWIGSDGTDIAAAGRFATRQYIIQKFSGEPLDSLDDLYQLEGTFKILNVYENANNTSEKVDFSFPVLFDPNAAEAAAPEAAFVTETAHCTLDGIYVDNSYADENSPGLKMVYVLYTAFTNDQNLKVCSMRSEMEFASGNTYSSEFYSKANHGYMPSYYCSNYLEEIFIGGSRKVMSVFQVPEAEFANGEVITVKPYGLPDGEVLKVAAADVKFFDDAGALAEAADPEGYAQALLLRQPADADTVSKVKKALNGYYWSFYVNSTGYQIEFYSPNTFEVRVSALGVANRGKYEVQNGFLVCTYDSNGAVVEIPWHWGESDIEIDVTTAFSVNG